jgi:cell division protease FtsH
MVTLPSYAAAHRQMLDIVAREAGFADPVAFTAVAHYWPLLKASRRERAFPIDGVIVHDWNPSARKIYPGVRLGGRIYEIQGIRFAVAQFVYNFEIDDAAVNFLAVERRDYRRLYRIAQRCLEDTEPASEPPILPAAHADILWKNTIGYLESGRLEQVRAFGGRARRGILLTGAPGNGKTMACRWIWDECRRRGWEYRIVTPNTYRQARRGCNAEEAVRALFTVQRRGVVFFDDMDIALRDRERVNETEDQAVFLTALDGISIKEGVVYVFTTNCAVNLIDRAFKRPGRIDVVLHFEPPGTDLRRALMQRWHRDIRANLCLDAAVADTHGYSFAEIEELKNLLIMHYADTGSWSWREAVKQLQANREDFDESIRRRVGFYLPAMGNGHAEE